MSELRQLRDSQLAIPIPGEPVEAVGFYPRAYYSLDNFSAFQVEYGDVIWPTSEHLYQAARFFDTEPWVVDQILNARSVQDAYTISRANAEHIPEYWDDDMKIGVMEEILRLKLGQHTYVQRKLLETGYLEIVEDSPEDDFWGWGPNRDGRNELGKIWMRLRQELRTGTIFDKSGKAA